MSQLLFNEFKFHKTFQINDDADAVKLILRNCKHLSENTRVARAAGVVGAATLLSRVLGFVRDMVIAAFFGAGLDSDAFFVAFRLPNVLRRLFAEGSLSMAFIPVFTEYLTHRGRKEAFELARSALRLLSILLALTAVAGVLLSPWLVRIIAPGFTDPSHHDLTVGLTRIMFPYIFFIGLVALCMGILNVLGHFAAPALAPVGLNVAIILAVISLTPHLDRPVLALALGVIAGGALQLALQVPFLIKKGFYFWRRAPLWHPGLGRIGRLMLPAIFGAAVYQINILVGTLLASLLPTGSVSYLYYADRLVQFPLGIFAIATATAVLPSLSRQAAAGRLDAVGDTFGHAVGLVLFITLPAMAGLIVLREPIVGLLFQRGAFDAQAVRLTASALLYYGVGLWAFATVRIVISTFYALQDTITPVKIACISIAANILLGLALMGPMAHNGLALATALASMINLGLLLVALRSRLGAWSWRPIILSACKSGLGSVIMALVVSVLAASLVPVNGPMPALALGLGTTIAAGLILYALLAVALKCPQLDLVRDMLRGRKRSANDPAIRSGMTNDEMPKSE